MAGLLGDLIHAAKSLTAHQAGVETAGRNLANVNNPQYARQRVKLGELVILDSPRGPRGSGVEALAIQQLRDQFLDAAVTREGAQTGYLQAQQSGLARAESALGESIDTGAQSVGIGDTARSTNGISAGINEFFNAFDAFASRPTDTGAKQVLLERASTLADRFNVIDQRLAALQGDLSAEINVGVENVNSLLFQIADLNRGIQQTEIQAPGSALGLRDQRQARLEELSKYINFEARTIPNGGGQIQLIAKDGAANDVVLVDRSVVFGNVSFSGTQFTTGSPPTVLDINSGALQGQLTVRDGAVQTLRTDLKRTADQLAAGVNAAYAATGDRFFQAPPASGLLALDPGLNVNTLRATATGNAGANEVALAVADVARTEWSTGTGAAIDGTIGGFYSDLTSGLGETLASANARVGDQELVERAIIANRDAVSSVSIDEEMTDLMKFQRAYQASSRVVTVIDSMLDELVNRMAR